MAVVTQVLRWFSSTMLLTLSSLQEYASMRVLAITAQSPQQIAERGGLPDRVRVLHQPAPAMAVRTWVEGELGRRGRPILVGVPT